LNCAIFGDVHSNYDALKVVLEDIQRERPDAIYHVGDIVGYGAEPSRCIEAIRALGCPTVAGNHDHAVVGKMDMDYFNVDALEAVMWTRAQLSEEEVTYLRSLELVLQPELGLLVHSTPADPASFGYIFSLADAKQAFDAMQQDICFVGHSHIPLSFWLADSIHYEVKPRLDLKGAQKAIINVGSVGQPRDRNPRAAYALFDTETRQLEIRRLDYDWESAAHKILQAGLPGGNAYRLALGV
jgi:diadenosine tetraphosphatase ApaH/serine/threonine PP2A family protein phosphatase